MVDQSPLCTEGGLAAEFRRDGRVDRKTANRAAIVATVAYGGDLREHGIHDNLKVLVIEDQALLRDVFAEFLEVLGYESDLAADGREGLARFDPFVHQVVVTDFLMPELTGLDLAEAIRTRGCTTPIVMLSGHAEPDDQQRAVQAGLRFLRKPVSFAQFEAAMAEVVEHAGAARQGRDPVHHATFPCPLCRDVGRIVTLEAELEPEPSLVTVTDLQGGCEHAAAFGELEGQTLEEAWRLIEAAVNAGSVEGT